jgi:hypothetical protein
MNYESPTTALIKTAIGLVGTTASIVLENVSVIVSIVAGVATALFMFQQYRNAKQKGKAFLEDRKNELD